jgi:hypothetical protein
VILIVYFSVKIVFLKHVFIISLLDIIQWICETLYCSHFHITSRGSDLHECSE